MSPVHAPRSLSILLVFLFSVVSTVRCHNWLGGLGRANLASTHYPYPPKIDPYPHMQVGLNQTFTVDWSAGHGNSMTLFDANQFAYFTVLHFDDRNKLPLTSVELYAVLEDYLANVPRSGNLSHPAWRRVHVLPPTNSIWFNEFTDITSSYFTGTAPSNSNDPRVVPRPANLMTTCKAITAASFSCDPNDPPSQWFYKDSWLNWDLRAEYFSAKYPWIESVHRFQVSVTQTVFANTYHSASFRIPARKGPGNYMLHWAWSGYYDVIDINVQAEPTANPYGPPPPSGGPSSGPTHEFIRVDHCEFSTFFWNYDPCRILNKATMNITQCLIDCLNNPICEEVQVMRVGNVVGSLAGVPPGAPTTLFDNTQVRDSIPFGPCGYYTQRERLMAGCSEMNSYCDLSGTRPDEYLCFASQFHFNPLLEATDGWSIVQEPEDPAFYSTCYFKRPVKAFRPFPPYPRPTSPWIIGDGCVDCAYWRKVSNNLTISEAPNWEGKLIFDKEGKCTPCS